MRPGIDRPQWRYPALLASVGRDQQPGVAALRTLVRRLRQEAGPRNEEPALQRRWVRQAVVAVLSPDEAPHTNRP